MSNFINIIIAFWEGIYQTEVFIYFLGSIVVFAVVLAILRLSRDLK